MTQRGCQRNLDPLDIRRRLTSSTKSLTSEVWGPVSESQIPLPPYPRTGEPICGGVILRPPEGPLQRARPRCGRQFYNVESQDK